MKSATKRSQYACKWLENLVFTLWERWNEAKNHNVCTHAGWFNSTLQSLDRFFQRNRMTNDDVDVASNRRNDYRVWGVKYLRELDHEQEILMS